MKVLILSNNPARASFRQRIGVHLDTLSAGGIDCEVVKLPGSAPARSALFKTAANFDAVLLHKKCLNVFNAPLLRRHARKLIYDFDDAVMYDPKDPERNSGSHFRPFRRTVKLADTIIAGNSYLAQIAREFNTSVNVLATGLDIAEYSLQMPPTDDGKIRLVWIGSKSTLRYLEQIKDALEQIGTHFENVVLRIICDDFLDFENVPVEKHIWSEQTQAADLNAADIGLAPLPDNRFTRGKCGFKILQYAAAALPVIASPVGVNTDYVADGTTGFLAADTSEWVYRITQLVRDNTLRKKMGEENRVRVRSFNASVIGAQLAELIKRPVQDPQP
ncbi:MAG: glycosyltransferase family 4 protein [Planctomycetota bacterium]|jgi:glycosyltransferase involved in cell wall biosynthesis